jgi:hypothetical protein
MVGSRVKSWGLALVVPVVLAMSIGVDVGATGLVKAPVAGAATTTSAPSCTFNGSKLPLVQGEKNGNTVTIQCTNMGSLHPYLVMEVSLLLAIDPAAAPLLDGQITSLAGLTSLLSALPEVNPLAEEFPISDLSGNMTVDYTLPTSVALDPNATCPPTTAQIDAGLIGCGLAMIDLTTFKPVGAGSGLVQYAGDPFLPPGPTLAVSATRAAPGARISVSDVPGAKTYWYLATLSALLALLGGSSGAAPKLSVDVHRVTSTTGIAVPNTVSVAPAVYNPPTLVPPKIRGSFVVETRGHGKRVVTVSYTASLDGVPLSITASRTIYVT